MATAEKSQIHKTASLNKTAKKWVSPFRLSGSVGPKTPTKNPANYSSYINAGLTPVPNKDESSPIEKVETQPEVETEAEVQNEEDTEVPETNEEDDGEEPLEPQDSGANDESNEEEEPLSVEDTSKKDVLNATPTESKSVDRESKPLRAPEHEIPKEISSRPKMLRRYKENWNLASESLNKNKIQNTERRINLGAGLILTEEQIYALARKKLQPVMNQIDQKVAENVAKDEAKAAQIEADIARKDEGIVANELAAFKATVDRKTEDIRSKHRKDLKALEDKIDKSAQDTKDHIETTKEQIITDQTDAEAAEEKASEDHITNKETLVNDADEFKSTKTQGLEEAKSQQIKEKEDAENFESEGKEFQTKADGLEKEVADKKLELEEKIKRVEALIAAKHEKKNLVRASIKKRKIAERNLNIIDLNHSQALANVTVLRNQTNLLNSRIAAHSTKINELKTSEKENLQEKRLIAEKSKKDWEEELLQLRIAEAKKQEQIKIEAEEERKRIEQEKAEEEARLQKQKEEEEAKLQKEKEEEEARLLKEKEEKEARLLKEKEEEEARVLKEKEQAAIKAEQKKKEEEEEAVRTKAEITRLKELKQIREEKLKLEKEIDEQNKAAAAAAKARLTEEANAKSSKNSESSGIGGAVLGAATSILGAGVAVGTAAGVAASVAATGAASGAVNAATSAVNAPISKGIDTPVSKSVSIPENKQTIADNVLPEDPFSDFSDSVTKDLGSNNPFYGVSDDKDDIPSTIEEHPEEDEEDEATTPVIQSERPVEDLDDDVATQTDKTETETDSDHVKSAGVDSGLTAPPTAPTTAPTETSVTVDTKPRRSSMVDEAISKMSQDEIEKMNSPLTAKIQASPEKRSTSNNSRSNSLTKSRSNSLTTKLAYKKTGSRSNSLKAASTFVPKSKETAKNVAAEPVEAIGTASITPSTSGPDSLAYGSQAVKVEIKHEVPKVVNAIDNPPQSKHVSTAEEEEDSDLDVAQTKPIFTEAVGTPENSNDFVDVETLETVSSNEYAAHKHDPNYMEIDV